MEDITTLIWIGLAVVWFLTRLVRRGAKKAQREQRPPRPTVSRPTAAPDIPKPRFGRIGPDSRDFSGPGGTGPPPIEPR